MQASPEFLRALAALMQCLVAERGLSGAAAFLHELAATLDVLERLRDHRYPRNTAITS